MAKINIPRNGGMDTLITHEGGIAKRIDYEQQLRRSIMSCLLWENTFYEDGVEISARIKELIPKVSPWAVYQMAIEAREKMKLRHIPLFIIREMSRIDSHKVGVASLLERVIQRADELAEFLGYFISEGNIDSNTIYITNTDEKLNERIEYLFDKIFDVTLYIPNLLLSPPT